MYIIYIYYNIKRREEREEPKHQIPTNIMKMLMRYIEREGSAK